MSLPPFTMSKYISELDLHKDAHAYYKTENDTLRDRIEELTDELENVINELPSGYPESAPNAAGSLVSTEPKPHQMVEYHIQTLRARIAELTECRCSLRIKLVGDGCSVCNPDLWKELIPQPEGEDT